jgi:chromosome segregation ATPase
VKSTAVKGLCLLLISFLVGCVYGPSDIPELDSYARKLRANGCSVEANDVDALIANIEKKQDSVSTFWMDHSLQRQSSSRDIGFQKVAQRNKTEETTESVKRENETLKAQTAALKADWEKSYATLKASHISDYSNVVMENRALKSQIETLKVSHINDYDNTIANLTKEKNQLINGLNNIREERDHLQIQAQQHQEATQRLLTQQKRYGQLLKGREDICQE